MVLLCPYCENKRLKINELLKTLMRSTLVYLKMINILGRYIWLPCLAVTEVEHKPNYARLFFFSQFIYLIVRFHACPLNASTCTNTWFRHVSIQELNQESKACGLFSQGILNTHSFRLYF